MAIKLGNHEFSTKADVTQRTREILYRRKVVRPGTEDFDFLCALLDVHLHKDEKTGVGIAHFFVTQLEFNAPNFNIRRVDGTAVNFSFVKCVNALGRSVEQAAQSEYLRHLSSAYRAAVHVDILAFREDHEHRCGICGADIVGLPQVDHVAPQFAGLVCAFEQQSGMLVPRGFEECGAVGYHQNGRKFCTGDVEYERAWVEFHRKHAVMRLVCAGCNLGRERERTPKGKDRHGNIDSAAIPGSAPTGYRP
jgi:hypothetical protein